MPGSIHSPLSRGCHQLIKQGARLVESAQDIFDELGLPPVPQALPTLPAEPSAGSDAGARVLAGLGHDPCTLDDLVMRTGLTADALLAILMGLELEGRVAALSGNRYQRLQA